MTYMRVLPERITQLKGGVEIRMKLVVQLFNGKYERQLKAKT